MYLFLGSQRLTIIRFVRNSYLRDEINVQDYLLQTYLAERYCILRFITTETYVHKRMILPRGYYKTKLQTRRYLIHVFRNTTISHVDFYILKISHFSYKECFLITFNKLLLDDTKLSSWYFCKTHECFSLSMNMHYFSGIGKKWPSSTFAFVLFT